MSGRIARLVMRVVVAAAILWGVISVPLPFEDNERLLLLRIPIAVLLFVIYAGKTLYDTFFYERKP
jgi:hypothetical protein